jgi:hypothetical protein
LNDDDDNDDEEVDVVTGGKIGVNEIKELLNALYASCELEKKGDFLFHRLFPLYFFFSLINNKKEFHYFLSF